jgi:hypothetical protein
MPHGSSSLAVSMSADNFDVFCECSVKVRILAVRMCQMWGVSVFCLIFSEVYLQSGERKLVKRVRLAMQKSGHKYQLSSPAVFNCKQLPRLSLQASSNCFILLSVPSFRTQGILTLSSKGASQLHNGSTHQDALLSHVPSDPPLYIALPFPSSSSSNRYRTGAR